MRLQRSIEPTPLLRAVHRAFESSALPGDSSICASRVHATLAVGGAKCPLVVTDFPGFVLQPRFTPESIRWTPDFNHVAVVPIPSKAMCQIASIACSQRPSGCHWLGGLGPLEIATLMLWITPLEVAKTKLSWWGCRSRRARWQLVERVAATKSHRIPLTPSERKLTKWMLRRHERDLVDWFGPGGAAMLAAGDRCEAFPFYHAIVPDDLSASHGYRAVDWYWMNRNRRDARAPSRSR